LDEKSDFLADRGGASFKNNFANASMNEILAAEQAVQGGYRPRNFVNSRMVPPLTTDPYY